RAAEGDLADLHVYRRQAARIDGGQPLGAWSLKVRPGSNGVAFNDLDLDLRGLHVNGSLRWDGSPGNHRSTHQG
ncbi:hypothetical protein ACV348_32930, partial [Pseudomonas aeruginosa]